MTKKSDLIDQATAAGLTVTTRMTIAQIQELLKQHEADSAKQTARQAKNQVEVDSAQQIAEEVENQVEADKATDETDSDAKFAKAGKRSAKSVAEAEAEVARQQRYEQLKQEQLDQKPKRVVKQPRPKQERKGKKYKKAWDKIDRNQLYSIAEAVALAKQTTTTEFDSTVELIVSLDVNVRLADQNIRSSILLPAGHGRQVRVAVITKDDTQAQAAKKSGADLIADDGFWQELDKGQFNFDVLVSDPSLMAKLSKYARVLGPRGLMPDPKNATVTIKMGSTVDEIKTKRVNYRVDETGVIHLGVGKSSFSDQDLIDNIETVFADIRSSRPSSLKSNKFIKKCYLTTTMGPSIKISSAQP